MVGSQEILAKESRYPVREAMTNCIIHADLMLNSVLKVERLLRLPVEQIYAGEKTRARNQRLQNMFRMIGFGENLGSGFPLILSAWNEKGSQGQALLCRGPVDMRLSNMKAKRCTIPQTQKTL